MGVTASGKTTLGRRLAQTLGWRFHDADDFHSPANKAKMHSGVPLTDEDRWPWLDAIRAAIEQDIADGASAVVACSALRDTYRHRLMDGLDEVRLVLLDGDPAVLAARLTHRHHEFMNPALLQSQLETLERPAHALVVDIALTIDAQIALVRRGLGV